MFDTNDSYDESITCDQSSRFVRTENCTCNNFDIPAMGAAGILFGRNVNPAETYAENDEQLLTPNPNWIPFDVKVLGKFSGHKFFFEFVLLQLGRDFSYDINVIGRTNF